MDILARAPQSASLVRDPAPEIPDLDDESLSTVLPELHGLGDTVASWAALSSTGAGRDSALSTLLQLESVVSSIRRLEEQHETDRSDLRAALIHSIDLERTTSLQSDALAMIGHDIRTPLAVVLAALDVLGDVGQPPNVQRAALLRARAAGQQVSSLLSEALVMAVAESARDLPGAESLELVECIPELLMSIPGGEEVRLEIVAASAPVTFNKSNLGQILANLVGNAFRHGREPVTVAIVARTTFTEIHVADAGSGVAAHALRHLFERFAPAPRPSRLTSHGTGLGLYLAHQLTSANGATLAYRPRAGDLRHHFVVRIPSRGLNTTPVSHEPRAQPALLMRGRD